MNRAPILTLQTLEPERPLVMIDGVLYELQQRSDLGLLELAQVARMMEEAQALQSEVDAVVGLGSGATGVSAAVTEAQAQRALVLADAIVAVILRAPAEVRARLSLDQKVAIMQAFPATLEPATATPDPSRSTSEPSSPDSPTTTVPAMSGS